MQDYTQIGPNFYLVLSGLWKTLEMPTLVSGQEELLRPIRHGQADLCPWENRRDALEASWGTEGRGSPLHPLQLGPGMTTCISRQQKLNQGQQRSVTTPAQTPIPQAVSSLWHGHGCDVHQLYCRAVIFSVLWLCSLRRWVEGTQALNSGIPFSSAFRRQ